MTIDERHTRDIRGLVRRCTNAADEANAAAHWLVETHRAGYSWRDMALLAPGKRNWRDPLAKALARAAIPHDMLLGDPHRHPQPGVDQVLVMTLHAAQGLEFPAVALVGIGDFPWKSQTLEEAVRLVHVAMTRATHVLQITHSKRSALVERLLEA